MCWASICEKKEEKLFKESDMEQPFSKELIHIIKTGTHPAHYLCYNISISELRTE